MLKGINGKIFGIWVLLSWLPSYAFSENSMIGVYETVSESEWSIRLELKKNSRAEIISESWAPGSSKVREVTKLSARWKKNRNSVEVKSKETTDILEFRKENPLDELGKLGVAPGLVHVKTIGKKSPLDHLTLWKKPFNF